MTNAFQNACVRGVQYGKIRKLSGFRTGHRIPEDHFDAAQAFVQKIGHEEVKAQSESLHAGIRTLFGYPRKALTYHCEAGAAAIKTPDFAVDVAIGQDNLDPAQFALSTEVRFSSDAEIITSPGFASIFNPCCDRIVILFESPIQLEDKIDAIEGSEKLRPLLTYAPDCSHFSIKDPTSSLHIAVTTYDLTLSLLAQRNLGLLIQHSLKALEQFAVAGFALATAK
jgi:hypothetical protein